MGMPIPMDGCVNRGSPQAAPRLSIYLSSGCLSACLSCYRQKRQQDKEIENECIQWIAVSLLGYHKTWTKRSFLHSVLSQLYSLELVICCNSDGNGFAVIHPGKMRGCSPPLSSHAIYCRYTISRMMKREKWNYISFESLHFSLKSAENELTVTLMIYAFSARTQMMSVLAWGEEEDDGDGLPGEREREILMSLRRWWKEKKKYQMMMKEDDDEEQKSFFIFFLYASSSCSVFSWKDNHIMERRGQCLLTISVLLVISFGSL